MRLEFKTAPAAVAIERDDVKTYSFMNTTKYDNLIDALLIPCTEEIERYTGRRLINQSWYIYLDAQEYYNRLDAYLNSITLSTLNVSAITEVLTYSKANASTVLTSSDYRLSGNAFSGISKLVFNDNTPPQYLDLRNTDAVRIEVVTGYGAAKTDIPDTLSTALKMLIEHRVKYGDKQTQNKLYEDESNYLAALQGYRSVENWF
jgi:uncharacterized phiE125 gp8 family phage protein